jgi:MFS family permease
MTVISQPRVGTFTALRHANFRYFFGGQIVAISGMWMLGVAQGWLVFHLTRSEMWLGLVACAAGAPSLILSPFAGVVIDRFPRRNILFVTQSMQMLLGLGLAALAFADVIEVWHVLVFAFLTGLTKSLDAPTRQTFIRDLVGQHDLPSGITLNSLMVNSGRIIGPSLAGALLVSVGAAWCFLFNGLAFSASLFALSRIHLARPTAQPSRGAALAQLREGIAFSRGHAIIGPLLLLAAVSSFLVANIMTILPAFADRALHSPINGYATLSTSQGVGAVLAGILMTGLAARFGRGRVASVMLIGMVFSALLMSRMTQLELAALFIAGAGFCQVMFFVNVNTMIQNAVPDDFRGRVMSLFTLTFLGLMPFGALLLGFIAEAVGPGDALAFYALVNGLIGLGILSRWPQVTNVP